MPRLPRGWQEARAPNNKSYFFNKASGEVQWEFPITKDVAKATKLLKFSLKNLSTKKESVKKVRQLLQRKFFQVGLYSEAFEGLSEHMASFDNSSKPERVFKHKLAVMYVIDDVLRRCCNSIKSSKEMTGEMGTESINDRVGMNDKIDDDDEEEESDEDNVVATKQGKSSDHGSDRRKLMAQQICAGLESCVCEIVQQAVSCSAGEMDWGIKVRRVVQGWAKGPRAKLLSRITKRRILALVGLEECDGDMQGDEEDREVSTFIGIGAAEEFGRNDDEEVRSESSDSIPPPPPPPPPPSSSKGENDDSIASLFTPVSTKDDKYRETRVKRQDGENIVEYETAETAMQRHRIEPVTARGKNEHQTEVSLSSNHRSEYRRDSVDQTGRMPKRKGKTAEVEDERKDKSSEDVTTTTAITNNKQGGGDGRFSRRPSHDKEHSSYGRKVIDGDTRRWSNVGDRQSRRSSSSSLSSGYHRREGSDHNYRHREREEEEGERKGVSRKSEMQRPLHDERGSHNSSSDQSHRRRHARQNSPKSHGELPPTVASRERLDARDPSFGEINGRTRARDTQQAPGQMKYPGFSQGSFQPSAQHDRHHSGRDHLREHHLDAHRDESRGSSSGGERNGEKRRRRSTLPTSLSNATPWRRNDANSNNVDNLERTRRNDMFDVDVSKRTPSRASTHANQDYGSRNPVQSDRWSIQSASHVNGRVVECKGGAVAHGKGGRGGASPLALPSFPITAESRESHSKQSGHTTEKNREHRRGFNQFLDNSGQQPRGTKGTGPESQVLTERSRGGAASLAANASDSCGKSRSHNKECHNDQLLQKEGADGKRHQFQRGKQFVEGGDDSGEGQSHSAEESYRRAVICSDSRRGVDEIIRGSGQARDVSEIDIDEFGRDIPEISPGPSSTIVEADSAAAKSEDENGIYCERSNVQGKHKVGKTQHEDITASSAQSSNANTDYDPFAAFDDDEDAALRYDESSSEDEGHAPNAKRVKVR